jgi:hypothetical protein
VLYLCARHMRAGGRPGQGPAYRPESAGSGGSRTPPSSLA